MHIIEAWTAVSPAASFASAVSSAICGSIAFISDNAEPMVWTWSYHK